ncbi:MAG: OmpA family protein [Magnetococcales bacterium]|nr:OmpA family protein [Magnetococcales bacterium]
MSTLLHSCSQEEDGHWISVSDLMAGLMVIFMFIAISYMRDVVVEKERIEQIAITWNETQEALHSDLEAEFKNDLEKWNAALDRETLSIRFKEPSVLFSSGESALNAQFKAILNSFFPRYLQVLKQYRDDISEVRIEGHTSSIWSRSKSAIDGYFKNMRLSQDRTRSVLQYCLQLPQVQQDASWARSTITANGLSSSRPILLKDGKEDATRSRRVEFRVRTNAEQKIVQILRTQK